MLSQNKCKCGGKLFWHLGMVEGKAKMVWQCEKCKAKYARTKAGNLRRVR